MDIGKFLKGFADIVLVKNIMYNNKVFYKKAGAVLGFIASVLVVGFVFFQITLSPVVEQEIIEAKRVNTLVTGDPEAGKSGFFYFMIYPHQANPSSAYASNLSTSNAYEYATSGDVACTGETPFNTPFDIVVKVGVNVTDGWNTTSNKWDNNYMWCLLTCSNLSIASNTNMSEIEIKNTSSYRWMHYYLNNGGSGYTISEGQKFDVTDVQLWVKRLVS